MAESASPTPVLPPQIAPPRVVLGDRDPVADAETLALPVLPADTGHDTTVVLGPGAARLSDELDLLGVLESERATGSAGEVVVLPLPGGTTSLPRLRRVLFVGVGEQSRRDFRRAGAALARASRDRGSVVTTIPGLDPDTGLEPFVAGVVLASFSFDWRAGGPERRPVESIVLGQVDASYAPALERAEVIAGAGWRARFLATVPSNVKNPAWLADQAVAAAEEAGLAVRVWDEKDLAAGGFGGILGVGQASATPPRMVRLDYTPRNAGRRTPTVAIVGKGITFDTGGLSLKPGESMVNMKRDMTGAAVVIATMAALAAVDCPVRVVGLIAVAENAVSGSALRPGDVIRHYPGGPGARTSEVTNTDAEGRLVMADAMAYAVAEVKPAALVDVATLTGAVKVALGQSIGGLFADDDALAALIGAAAEDAGEPLWRLPLSASYEEKLSSSIADADNAGGGPGAITAALFLQHFTGEVPWAHLDVASVGDAVADRHEWTPGPTGWGARTLLTWLGSEDPLAGVG